MSCATAFPIFATSGIAMRHIRESEVIDRNAPELAGLFDHLRDTLMERHGVTRARYVHLVPACSWAIACST